MDRVARTDGGLTREVERAFGAVDDRRAILFISTTENSETLKAMATAAGGEEIDVSEAP